MQLQFSQAGRGVSDPSLLLAASAPWLLASGAAAAFATAVAVVAVDAGAAGAAAVLLAVVLPFVEAAVPLPSLAATSLNAQNVKFATVTK